MSPEDEDTVVEMPVVVSADSISAESFDECDVQIAALTHRGKVRTKNEDQFVVIRRTRTATVLATSVAGTEIPGGDGTAWLMAVADGLGGHVSGEVASATAIQTLVHFAGELSTWVMRPTQHMKEDYEQRAELYSNAISGALREHAASDPQFMGMGTTLTTNYIFGHNALVANVGDSRSYLIRDNQIRQITRDHTLATDLKSEGVSPDLVRPYENVLTRCFDTNGIPVNVDLFQLELKSGDQILLCSDGLTDMVPDQEILRTLDSASTTKEACEKLVIAALENGGKDNVTVVVSRIS